jgi:hypothetical protein
MEAACASGTSVAFQRKSRCYIPEDTTHHKDPQLIEVQYEIKEPKKKASNEKMHIKDDEISNYIQCQCLKH